MKATGIVRRIDDLGRVVIPKEIRRTLHIKENNSLHTSLKPYGRFCRAIHSVASQKNQSKAFALLHCVFNRPYK